MPHRKPMHVLIVEDNADQAQTLKWLLENRPEFRFTAEIAGTMASAEDRLARGGIDVVLLDLTLPDVSGTEAIHRVKAAAPSIGVIVNTGWSKADIERPALEAGASAVIQKGGDPSEVVPKLRFAVIERQQEQTAEAIEKILREMGELVVEAVDGDGLPPLPSP